MAKIYQFRKKEPQFRLGQMMFMEIAEPEYPRKKRKKRSKRRKQDD